jgi:hypothetical protein
MGVDALRRIGVTAAFSQGGTNTGRQGLRLPPFEVWADRPAFSNAQKPNASVTTSASRERRHSGHNYRRRLRHLAQRRPNDPKPCSDGRNAAREAGHSRPAEGSRSL